MVDTLVSGASASRRVGSTPIMRTRAAMQAALFLTLAFDVANEFNMDLFFYIYGN